MCSSDLPTDHQRTRLTHALEVAQVARTIAAGIGANITLADAMALGHDCGHGPGGHASEQAFDAFIPKNRCNECAAIGKGITREDQGDGFFRGIAPDDPAGMVRKASCGGGVYFFAGYCSASFAASK